MKRPRDMSRAAFKAALKRNGLEQTLLWLRDVSGECPGISYGTVFDPRTGKTDRRASLAHALRMRAKHIEKMARDGAAKVSE